MATTSKKKKKNTSTTKSKSSTNKSTKSDTKVINPPDSGSNSIVKVINDYSTSQDEDLIITNGIPVSSSENAGLPDEFKLLLSTKIQNLQVNSTVLNLYNSSKDMQTESTSTISTATDDGSDILQQNSNQYPTATLDSNNKKYTYDWTLDVQSDIISAIDEIKKDLNVPSAYNRKELNKLFRTQFNRFRLQYPDYFMNGTMAYVVMTRPDLNLFKSDELTRDNLHDNVTEDPVLSYIAGADIDALKCLTTAYTSDHHFNPLLSNTLTSLDISDESIDTLETGETFTGYKTQYAKSNIRSMTAGTITLKFPETYNMGVTHVHQAWCTYESGVYRGTMDPKYKYIWGKELDYACDIYYFLLDKEDMILRYWTKYTGCFPLNVNKSAFSYDAGSEINHPELSVTYSYFAREDLSPLVLNEFNNNSVGGKVTKSFEYMSNYIKAKGLTGKTWAGPPFVERIKFNNDGLGNTVNLYTLRFRKGEDI